MYEGTKCDVQSDNVQCTKANKQRSRATFAFNHSPLTFNPSPFAFRLSPLAFISLLSRETRGIFETILDNTRDCFETITGR